MKQTPLNLHNLLDHVTYDHAVICTYTFDPEFFEDYCLEKFNSLKTNGNISVIVDYGIYIQAITGQVDHRPKQANIRYLLHPITVPGRFHAKVFLFASKNKGRLIIGSANFTKPGITSNAEMINYYDYEVEKNEEFKFLFKAAFNYLTEISYQWPSSALTSNLKDMEREASWLVAEEAILQKHAVTFLHNLKTPLWNQIISEVVPPVGIVYILSRFFDANPSLLERVMKDLKPKKIIIYTQNGITTLTNEWLRHPLFKDRSVEIYCCTYKDEDHNQALHAKAIAIKKDNHCLLAFGSANFTTPALMREASRGNAESILLLTTLSAKDIRPEKLFDPLENAYQLKDDGTLQSSTRQTDDIPEPMNKIVLHYAELMGSKIKVKMIIKSDLDYDSLNGKIQFQDEAYLKIALHHDHDEEYSTTSVESILGRLGEYSSIIIIEAIKGNNVIATSNPILITNLLDIQSGQYVRRERHIREAQHSAMDFFRILENLIKEGDEEPLITFFNLCDIPIMDASRPSYPMGMRSVWDGGKGMRSLGARNLTIFHNLHEAAMSFYTRHFKKLQRHVKNGSINGVANYLHIFLAMGGILRSQVERLMQGLEASNTPISSYEWGQCRMNIDIYFIKFKELMSILHDQYLPKLLKDYKIKILKEKFDPDLQPIKDLCMDMLKFQSRMDVMTKSNLKIKIPNGNILHPPFFNDDVFLSKNWVKYENEQGTKMKKILQQLAA